MQPTLASTSTSYSTLPTQKDGQEADASLPPPPGLPGQRPVKIQKATAEAWAPLEPALQQKLKDLGIAPPPPNPEPDLKDVLVENMAQLPPTVRELVEKLTKPAPPTEADVASQLKSQVSHLKDLSHRKQSLQHRIDNTRTSSRR